MSEKLTKEEIEALTNNFEDKYHQVLSDLDGLHKGLFDEDEATAKAALCLLAQAALLKTLASADLQARALKRDIDFARASAYAKSKRTLVDGKKVTDSAADNMATMDPEVQRLSQEQITAERDYKYLSNIHSLLKEAHLTFRSIKIRNPNA